MNLAKIVGIVFFTAAGMCLALVVIVALVAGAGGIAGDAAGIGFGVGFISVLYGACISFLIGAWGALFWTLGLMLNRIDKVVGLLTPYTGDKQ